MNLPAKVGRTTLAMLLGVFLAGITASAALAEGRGKSGLPSGSGNPMAQLQREIDAVTQRLTELSKLGQSVAALTEQLAALQKQMTTLQQQMAAYASLQQQVYALNGQVTSLNTQVVALNGRLGSLGSSNFLAVYDAHDKKIGDVVGVQDEVPWVSVTAGGQVVALRVFSGQLLGGFVWFEKANCAGTAYISDIGMLKSADVLSFAAVREPGGVIYAAAPKTPLGKSAVVNANVMSLAQQDGTCLTFASQVTTNLVKAEPVMTLDLQYSRPYSVH